MMTFAEQIASVATVGAVRTLLTAAAFFVGVSVTMAVVMWMLAELIPLLKMMGRLPMVRVHGLMVAIRILMMAVGIPIVVAGYPVMSVGIPVVASGSFVMHVGLPMMIARLSVVVIGGAVVVVCIAVMVVGIAMVSVGFRVMVVCIFMVAVSLDVMVVGLLKELKQKLRTLVLIARIWMTEPAKMLAASSHMWRDRFTCAPRKTHERKYGNSANRVQRSHTAMWPPRVRGGLEVDCVSSRVG